jgi:dihydroneopterin aldolase
MISVHLKDVEIHAFHGVYEGEDKIGSNYLINLECKYDEKDSDFNDINGTINYVELYDIVKNRMQVTTGLLEKICDSIIRHIRHQYPFVREVSLSIYKLHAPIKDFQGNVGVSMKKKFND